MGENNSSVWEVNCWANSTKAANKRIGLGVSCLRSGTGGELMTSATFSFIDVRGVKQFSRKIIKGLSAGGDIYYPALTHEELREYAATLMPGGTLTIRVEIQVFVATRHVPAAIRTAETALAATAWTSDVEATAEEEEEDLYKTMAEDRFVDLGERSSGLRLFFREGRELRCHTFPLAARYRIPVYSATCGRKT
jgi:hypothetical protein